MALFPLGGLVSFAGYDFDPLRSTYVTDYNHDFAISSVALPDAEYPADLWYSGPAPLKDPVASWQYLLLADCTLPTIPVGQIEEQYGAIYNALTLPTGQKGLLTANSWSTGGPLACQARIMKLPLKLVPGRNNTSYFMTLTFALYGPWS